MFPRGYGGATLNILISTGTLVFQGLVEVLLLSMAIPFVHCGANTLIASWAVHFSTYHAKH